MLIFFQIQFVIAQWEVYYSSFNRPVLIYCTDDTCPFGFKKYQSTQRALYKNCSNPKGTALILQDSQMSTISNYQMYPQNANSINHTIVFDVYYISQWNNDALIFEYKNQAYQFIYSTQNPLKFVEGACNSEQYDVRTYQISLPYTYQFTEIKFSLTNSLTKALIKNIHFSYITCHPTCKTCTGKGYNQCTSCLSDVTLTDGICRCPYGQTQYGLKCKDYCLLGATDRRERYCKAYPQSYFLYLHLVYFQYSKLINWDIIYDPMQLNNQNKKAGPLFGIFRYNEGASTIVNTTYFVYPLGVQLYLYTCNATPINSGISIYLNNTYYSSIYYDGTKYIGNNLYIYLAETMGLSGCTSARHLLLYANLNIEQGGFSFAIKGNFTSGNSGWYLVYAIMSSSQCPIYCLKCEKSYICSKCVVGYRLVSDGNCVKTCPKTSILQNNIYTNYLIQLFYDFTVPENIKSTFVLESSTSEDFQKGNEVYWSYIDTNVVYGGKYVWATARFSQIYTIDSPHHSLTIYFDAVFGCNFDGVTGYLGYSVNNQTETSVTKNSTVSINVTTPSPTLSISFQCYGATNNVLDKYCAIGFYYIVVHYCSPYCLQCTDENNCLQMDNSVDTSVIILNPSSCSSSQYYDDKYYRCEECPQLCETCLNEFECLSCKHPYQILITSCVLQCKINEYFDEYTQICDLCNPVCKQCQLKNECIHCEQSKFRYLLYNQCLCYDGYYDDNINVECQVCDVLCTKCFGASNMECNECITVDKVEKTGNTCNCKSGYYFVKSDWTCMQCHNKCVTCFSSSENSCLSCSSLENRILDGLHCSCSTGYYEVNNLCVSCPNIEDSTLYQCYKQCGDNSTIWFNQICSPISCLMGFTNQNNQCFPICGDLIINGNEECDDGNTILDDGCYNCRFQCPMQCTICNQDTTLPCPNVCGDNVISGSEECDDGNLVQFDGCHQCKLECQIQCTQCMRGQCYQCQTYGWIVDIASKTCIENCGDLIVIGREQCDDGYTFDSNDGCYQCKRVCRDDCLNCSSDGLKCLECQVGFQPFDYYCKNICGDGYLAIDPFNRNTEKCDDFNSTDFDGCSKLCKFQCQTTLCKTCVNNKCLECIDNYYLDKNKNKCIELCNDNIIVGQEICEDMNSLLYDGCYNCQLSCQSSCQNCSINGCLSCLQGYRLIGNLCQSICGDGLKVPEEDCDDGNLIPFDGCHGCKYSCNPTCLTCYLGRCLQCQVGYLMYNRFCEKKQAQINHKLQRSNLDGNLNPIIQNRPTKLFNEFCKEAINGTCLVCQDNYYLNSITSICQSLCGDAYINGYEQCDDRKHQSNMICNQCKLYCSENCKICQFGICTQCDEGYFLRFKTNSCEIQAQCNEIGLYFDSINNVCYDQCGDGLISPREQCEDDNDDPYDGCYKCKYSCFPTCPLCILGKCADNGNTCKVRYYFDTQTASCFNICGDGIVAIPDEECDSEILLDDVDSQCDNCKVICNNFCEICDSNQQCIQCKENYELLNRKCYPKELNHQQCLIENCEYCEDSKCIECSIGYSYIPIENECQTICGDGISLGEEICDDGNRINGDGCDSHCKPSKNNQCVNNQCVYISHPMPQLKFVKEVDNSQIFYLTYDQQVKLSEAIQFKCLQSPSNRKQIIKLQISLDQESYKYFQIEINIGYEEIIINPIFSIHFTDLNIIINEFGMTSIQQDISIQLQSPNVLSVKQKQITQSLIKFSGYQIKIIAGLILLSSFGGKFEIIQNQIDTIQQLYYLKYINTRKGQNLIQFFETFRIIQLTNLYDFIGFNPSNDLYFGFSSQKSEAIFEEDGRNANYLANFIQISTVFALAYLTHFAIQILINYSMNKIQNFQIQNFNLFLLHGFKKVIRFSINNCRNRFSEQFKGLFQSLIYEYTISSFLSLIYQDFDSIEGKFSLILNGGVTYLLFYYLLFQKHSENKLHIEFTYSCVQKLLFGVILIVCFKSAILQIQLCALNEFIYFYHLFKLKSDLDKFQLFKKQLQHFSLFIINIMLLITELYKNDPFKLIQIGWAIIAMMSSVLSMTLMVDVCKIVQPFLSNLLDRLKQQRPIFKNHEILDQIQQNNFK
ncbi:unnamed protein product [Paramecium octaurelia]|uniref:EGF-like domain-containing protein n=1 Tax=Paramecium octaurelia TaxID=43137 RepID=A0A8S1TLF1_PAROT|nr:unnamed protein product [Paramecium octaurelia]